MSKGRMFNSTEELTPGVNVDFINVEKGLAELKACGYDSSYTRMVIGYCLQRWAKGEEDLAERTAINEELHGVNFTSWRRILAAAMMN